MIVDRKITIHLEPREDGGLRIWSDDLPGLVLSSLHQELVLEDLPEAITGLLTHGKSGVMTSRS